MALVLIAEFVHRIFFLSTPSKYYVFGTVSIFLNVGVTFVTVGMDAILQLLFPGNGYFFGFYDLTQQGQWMTVFVMLLIMALLPSFLMYLGLRLKTRSQRKGRILINEKI